MTEKAILIIDHTDELILSCDQSALNMLGYGEAELLGRNPDFLMADRGDFGFFNPSSDAAPTQTDQYHTKRYFRCKDGTRVFCEQTLIPLIATAGPPQMVLAVLRAIAPLQLDNSANDTYIARLNLLRAIEKAILSGDSVEEITQAVLSRIRKLISCMRSSVTIFTINNSVDEMLAVNTDGSTRVLWGLRLDIEEFSGIKELRSGKVYAVNEISKLPVVSPLDRLLLDEGINSYLKVPLIHRGNLIGTLNIARSSKGAFSASEMMLAREIADSLAIALQQAQLFKNISRHRQKLMELGARLVEINEQEKTRLARELHDHVGTNLTALGINLNLLHNGVSAGSDKGEEILQDSQQLLEEMAHSIRAVMSDLRPAVLDELGLLGAIRWLAKKFTSRTGIMAGVEGEPASSRQAPGQEMHLFRIVQEALTNVAKHSRAGRVRIEFQNCPGKLVMMVEDDGIGFDPRPCLEPDEKGGWGILHMQERARSIGGCLRIESAKGQGTTIYVEI